MALPPDLTRLRTACEVASIAAGGDFIRWRKTNGTPDALPVKVRVEMTMADGTTFTRETEPMEPYRSREHMPGYPFWIR